MAPRLLLVLVLLALWPALRQAQSAPGLRADESVVLFPTDGRLDPESGDWLVPLHGWVFEFEPDSLWRRGLLTGFAAALDLDVAAAEDTVFRRRAGYFLADNERGKRIDVRLLDRVFRLEPSAPDGHFHGVARLRGQDLPGAGSARRLSSAVVLPASDGRRFAGSVYLVPPDGLSVVSDLDDTIKISGVTDKRVLLENSFLKPFRAVPGMAAAYRRWQQAGASFHYLSASPWQLYPALADFLEAEGFPGGSVQLKGFRVKDESFFDLFAAPEAYKIPAIESLLRRYPSRRFVLVGDSGEKDPEIYGEIARRFPAQVAVILIRQLPNTPPQPERYDAAFRDVPGDRWRLFRDATALADLAAIP